MIGKSGTKLGWAVIGLCVAVLGALSLLSPDALGAKSAVTIQTVYFDPWSPPLDVATPIECQGHPGTCGYACFSLTVNPAAFSCEPVFYNFTKQDPGGQPGQEGTINYTVFGPGSPELTPVHLAECASEPEVCGLICFYPPDNSAVACHEVIFEQ